MRIKYAIAVAGMLAVPILGGGVAYASTTSASSPAPASVSVAAQNAPETSATANDPVGGANLQQGLNVEVQSGAQSGGVDVVGGS